MAVSGVLPHRQSVLGPPWSSVGWVEQMSWVLLGPGWLPSPGFMQDSLDNLELRKQNEENGIVPFWIVGASQSQTLSRL